MIAFLLPGQGSQRPGILAPWLTDPESRELLERFNSLVEFDLIEAGTRWESIQLRDTRIAQPLLFAASFVAARLATRSGIEPSLVAGHSVGEWVGAAVSGVFNAADAMQLVTIRAHAMADACAATPTAMAAVLGGDPQEVRDTYARLGLFAANNNGLGQVVVAGATDAIEAFAAAPPPHARIRVLGVAGAFHTPYMEPAVELVRQAALRTATEPARVGLVSNLDGHVIHDSEQVRDRLVAQIAAPVRWDLCMQTLIAQGVQTTIEMCPAGTLSGMGKRNTPNILALRIENPESLATEALQALRVRSIA